VKYFFLPWSNLHHRQHPPVRMGPSSCCLMTSTHFQGPKRRDATALDPELLQLVELAPSAYCENSIADVLYSQWLMLPETTKLVSLQRALSPPRLLLWFVIKFPMTLKHFVSRSMVTLPSASSTWSASTVCWAIYVLLA
jgi:hypothetical protein